MRVERSHTEWVCVPTFSRLSTDSRCVSVGESLLVCWKRGSGTNTGSDQNPRASVTVDRAEQNHRNFGLVKIFCSIVPFSGISAC